MIGKESQNFFLYHTTNRKHYFSGTGNELIRSGICFTTCNTTVLLPFSTSALRL